MLSAAWFTGIVRDTPLISIDLVISYEGDVDAAINVICDKLREHNEFN